MIVFLLSNIPYNLSVRKHLMMSRERWSLWTHPYNGCTYAPQGQKIQRITAKEVCRETSYKLSILVSSNIWVKEILNLYTTDKDKEGVYCVSNLTRGRGSSKARVHYTIFMICILALTCPEDVLPCLVRHRTPTKLFYKIMTRSMYCT